MIYRNCVRPLLFSLEAEKAHRSGLNALKGVHRLPGGDKLLRSLYELEDEHLKTRVFGLDFPNPLGIAAGLDKNAEAYGAFGALGAGFVEIGTVTPRPQKGNPKPRLFRLPKDHALLNRMGFNNEGVEAIVERIRERKGGTMVGANLGKNRDTPNEDAANDIAVSLKELQPWVDYFVINVSSPNTPGLRELQEKEALKRVLDRSFEALKASNSSRPLLLKLSPDLELPVLDDLLGVAQEMGVDGLIATNTTVSREGLRTSETVLDRFGQGGISGAPVVDKANTSIRYIKDRTRGRMPVIGVGGVMSGSDALDKLEAGADLIQLYTGLIYEGPSLMKKILRAILQDRKQQTEKGP